ncbi:MAG: hypothetical protein LBQ89_00790, partial [Treponema sp.]|nr:hypothetical protein [Treponema sp.]
RIGNFTLMKILRSPVPFENRYKHYPPLKDDISLKFLSLSHVRRVVKVVNLTGDKFHGFEGEGRTTRVRHFFYPNRLRSPIP